MTRYRRRTFDQIRSEERARVATFMEQWSHRLRVGPTVTAAPGNRNRYPADTEGALAAAVEGLASNVRADLLEPDTHWPTLLEDLR